MQVFLDIVMKVCLVSDEPLAEMSVANMSVADMSVADMLVAEKSVADMSVADMSVADMSVVEKSVAEKSVADKSVADKLAGAAGCCNLHADCSPDLFDDAGLLKTEQRDCIARRPSSPGLTSAGCLLPSLRPRGRLNDRGWTRAPAADDGRHTRPRCGHRNTDKPDIDRLMNNEGR